MKNHLDDRDADLRERAPTARSAETEAPDATRRAPSARPLSVSTVQRLQSAAGNRALSGMLAQRRTTASRPATASAPTTASAPATDMATPSPAADQPADVVHEPDTTRTNVLSLSAGATDAVVAATLPVQRLQRPPAASSPKFSSFKSDVKGKQKTLAAHPPSATKANAAQAAAKPPADDKQAQGKAANAEKMNAAQPGSFDKAAFIAAVNKAIAEQAPKNLDEADNFGDSGKADAVKGQVQGQVGQGKEQSAKQIETTTKAAPDTSQAKEKQVTPLAQEPAPGNPGTPNPANAVPDKAPASATDFSAGPAQLDQQMASAQVTEEQLAKSNEPEFTGALKDKKAGEQHAETAPGQVRAAENQTLTDAKASAQGAATTSIEGMRGQKQAANNAVGQGQQGAQGKDESKRAQVTAKLQTVFDATQKDVEGILVGLDKKVDDAFSKGEKAARDSFTAEHKRKMDEYKDKRYSGVTGKLKWVKDKFAGLPEEANQIFVTARQGYVTKMQGVISNVADVIGGELTKAKQRIATGRQQLQAEVAKLPADLQAVGKEAAGEFAGKFDELTENVDAKGQELVQTLASKYNEALKSVDAEIEAEKEKNKGLIAKAVDAVKGVIDTILKLKDLLLGVLAKAAQAVMAILKDPIGFLGNLVSAVGAGLKAFMSNIGSHLKKGLIGWLLGSMTNAGIQLPDKFDLRGVITMIASLLGLTWGAIRGRIVQKGIPEQAMSAVEAGVPLIGKLQSEGVAGVTEEIKEQVGDLKENLLGKISEYLIPTVLIAGITWIISLLNPASAFIKACKMIIDIVTFIIGRGAQIIEFVNAVLDAVIAIAGGGAGGVPALIEGALAKSIPVLIGALAAILGIGGIANKVKSFFQALSKPVMKAVDWIVDKIVALGKKIWAKLKTKLQGDKGKGKDGANKAGPDGKGDLVGGEAAAHQLLRRSKSVAQAEEGMPAVKKRFGLADMRLVVDRRDQDYTYAHAKGTVQRDTTQVAVPEGEDTLPTDFDEAMKEYTETFLRKARNLWWNRYVQWIRKGPDHTSPPLWKESDLDPACDKGRTLAATDGFRKPLLTFFVGKRKQKAKTGVFNDHVFGSTSEHRKKLLAEVGPAIPAALQAAAASQLASITDDEHREWLTAEIHKLGPGNYDIGGPGYGALSLPSRRERTHTDYYPVSVTLKVNGKGWEITSVLTRAGQRFTVVEKGKPKPTSITVTGTDLRVKPTGKPRGTTTGPLPKGGYLDRAHIIADIFGGSGYPKAKNLVATSDVYNQEIMRQAEGQIAGQVEQFADLNDVDMSEVSFNLSVTVKLGELLQDVLDASLHKLDWYQAGDPEAEARYKALRDEVSKNPIYQVTDTNYQGVMRYGGQSARFVVAPIGPDSDIFVERTARA